jgi:Peptidase family C25
MKKIYHFFFCYFFLPASLLAQGIGNEWINYNQFYYKFPITKTGIYRITPSTLSSSGVNFANVDPRNFQLFGRGEQIPIYVKGENDLDGVFNNADFIEFFAQRNDGWLDTLAYDSPSHVTNPFYSLFTDTAFYFLTWNSSFSNLRMTVSVSDTDSSNYLPEPFYFQERLEFYNSNYYQGESDAAKVTDPEYTDGEGWMGASFAAGASKTINLTTSNAFLNGPASELKTNVSAWTNDFFSQENNHVKVSLANSVLFDSAFFGYRTFHYRYLVPTSQLTSNTSNLKIESIDIPGAQNDQYVAVAFAQLKYPHTFNLENTDSVFISIPNTILQTKTRFDIQNFNASSPVYLYDLEGRRRITALQLPGGYRLLFANFNKNFDGYITSESHISTVPTVYGVTSTAKFTNYAVQVPLQPDYLMITHSSLLSEAINYKNYRSSVAGGAHKVLLANVDELYDQYTYGIRRNPIAMRQFAKDALKNWAKGVQYLFLVGKGISTTDLNHEYYRNSATILAQNLVPSFGLPPCDNLITNHIYDSLLFAPAIPTGRIAVKNSQELSSYLDKIKEYESAPRSNWMKNVLHFGGGTNINEQNNFAGFLNNYKYVIEDTAFGGNVYTFLKTTSAPVQITLSDSVKALIETGVSLMTFFGHASGSSFDQSIDQPQGYNNVGRYPLILANSCYSGNIHNPPGQGESTINEDYVLYPNGGAIAFIAQVGQGIATYLNNYSTDFYNQIGKFNYGKPLSHSMKKTVLDIQANFLYMKALCLEMTLHGDPALVLNSFPLPDYSIEPQGIYFSTGIAGNNTINASLDTFYVNVNVNNIGRAIADSSVLHLKRIFPSGALPVTIDTVIKGVRNSDTIKFKFPIDRANGIGLNKFEVVVDYGNSIDEIDDVINNTAIADLNIISGFVSPVYPYNFSIVPSDSVTLLASTYDPLAPAADYFFQFDTNDVFSNNSPAFKSTTINSIGGVLSWKVPVQLNDSTVYYWRVSRSNVGTNQALLWKQSSFQYINSKQGWSQAHFPQFKNDEFKFLDYNLTQRKFNFLPASRSLSCITNNADGSNITALFSSSYSIDGQLQDEASCQFSYKIQVAIIDSLTLEAWGNRYTDNNVSPPFVYNPTHYFGNKNDNGSCRPQVEKYFLFEVGSASQMRGLIDMLKNSVPVGNYILAYTWFKPSTNWAANKDSVFDQFTQMGFDSLRYIYQDRPWIFFTQKGKPDSTQTVIGDTAYSVITFNTVISNKRKSGEVYSSLIGPASRWTSVHWQSRSVEQPSNDMIQFKVFGVQANGQESVIFDTLNVFKGDRSIQSVSATQYPYLRFYQYTSDEGTYTPSQLKRWQVIYDEIPEAAINPIRAFEFSANQVQEGDKINFKVAIENLSNLNMDSMLVRFWFVDKNRIIHELKTQRYKKLAAHDTLIASVSFSTLGYDGTNTLWMEANPYKNGTTTYDQLEQFHFNNFVQKEFVANKDKANPLLDVTFDGVHILDGDLVSAKPAISIQLKDESKYLALDNENLFKVFIRYPDQNADVLIPFDGTILRFVPASLPDNRCKVEYSPSLPQDGKYELIVQAKDKSNNRSGEIDYRISFEVINASTITEVMNYPNPFSNSTRFVFTLTGSEIPQNFRIQIMTITGKVVREIFQDELGPLHIGRNITQYAWDGKDNFGDQLANGVYFYRTVTKLNGENIERRETQADNYFKKGWGKMYLMR